MNRRERREHAGRLFENYFKIEKAYRKYFQDEMEKYHLTPNELLVLLFGTRQRRMQYGAGYCAVRGVSKGLVARSVESLVEKQFLVVERDAADKRICHLYLTQQCSALTEQMTEKKLRFSAGWPKAFRRKRLRRRNRHCAGLWKIYPHLLTSRKCFAIVRKESWNGKGAGNMRSADRRKAFCGLHDGGSAVFPSWCLSVADTDRPGAESDGRGRRGSTGYFTDDGLRLCLKRALSGTGSRIVTEYDCRDEKMTGAAEQRLFSSFTAVLFKIAEIPYAEAVVLTVTAACICLAGYRMVRFVHNSDGKKICPFGYHRYQKRHKIRIRKGKRRKWNIEIFALLGGLALFCMECIR